MQTAEGAFDEMTNIAYRMKELATQGASDANGTTEWAAQSAEYTALTSELDSIMKNTTFGGTALLEGATSKFAAAAGVKFQVGSSANETLTVNISGNLDATTGVAKNIDDIQGLTTGGFGSVTEAQAHLAEIDKLIAGVGSARSALGASMNRLEHTMTNVTNMKENTQAASSTLMDA
ncbi:flagellin N-terminal helical domain-containing protein, partial [Pseudoalteromonas distincta]|uniref:flagellin N-terminal helical domain-containing protein n=1 Tax=Pseudoalteromonas distincta TaxID=77608 RepID=UPI0034E8E2EE